ncbi:MAG TPA: hypothetical protein VIE86_04135 [Nitrososphaera sp.]|jgi:hypothetical protein
MRRIVLLLPIVALMCVHVSNAQGHFFGETRFVDEYQIIFAPSPSIPQVGSNTTYLNFSVLKNGSNIFGAYSALVITEKNSGEPVEQMPYTLYEYSDITIPYIFQKAGPYVVTLQTRIPGDEKYQAAPLLASFDLLVESPNQGMPIDELMLYFVTPAAVVITGIAIYLHSRKKI